VGFIVCKIKKVLSIEIIEKKGRNMPRNRRKKYDAGLQKSDAHAGGSKLSAEDRWVFREKPGLPIEGRRDEVDTRTEVSPPHHARHNYPSS
jgi:hypothetical protein